MAEDTTGGPAFPSNYTTGNLNTGYKVTVNDGMTLRDWFAGQALIGLLSGRAWDVIKRSAYEEAYKIADAMIAERTKE